MVVSLALALIASSCGDSSTGSEVLEIVDLPAVDRTGSVSLEEALAARESIRDFADRPLTLDEIGQLLWAAQGVTRSAGGRTNPSAGGLYPLEVYLVTESGLFHYLPDGHRAERLAEADLRTRLSRAAVGQEAVRQAPAVLVVCGVFARTEERYGDRATRYVHLEAGHVGQSLLLQAVALGLGGVPIGAFDDDAVRTLLGLPSDHEPLYLIPIGHPVSVSQG